MNPDSIQSISTEVYDNGGGKDDLIRLKGFRFREHLFHFGKYDMHGRSARECTHGIVSVDLFRRSKKRLYN